MGNGHQQTSLKDEVQIANKYMKNFSGSLAIKGMQKKKNLHWGFTLFIQNGYHLIIIITILT